MKLISIDGEDIFNLLSEAADKAYEDKALDEDDVLGPEDDLEETEYDVQEQSDLEEEESEAPVINVTVDNNYENDDDTNIFKDVDYSDLEEGIDALNKATAANNELLESIDDTLSDQYDADEKARREANIVTEESSPFSALIADDIEAENTPSSSSGGILDMFGDMFGFGSKEKGASPDKPKGKGLKAKLGRGIGALFGTKGRALTTIAGATLAGLGTASVMDKFNRDPSEVVSAVNAKVRSPFIDEDNIKINSESSTSANTSSLDTENTKDTNKTDTTSIVNNKLTSGDINTSTMLLETQRKMLASIDKGNEADYSVSNNEWTAPDKVLPSQADFDSPVSTPQDNNNILNALASSVGMGALYKGANFVSGMRTPVLEEVATSATKALPEVAETTLEGAAKGTAKAGTKGAFKGIPIIGQLLGAAMLGADIVDQRSQTYDNEDDKNRDTSKIVGSFAADTAAAMTGAAIGTAILPGVGTAIGGVVGYFASNLTGFSEVAGQAAADVYGIASSASATVNDAFDSLTSFFSTEEEHNEELAKVQQDTFKDIKDDISDTTLKSLSLSGVFGGMFGGSSNTQPPITLAKTNSNARTSNVSEYTNIASADTKEDSSYKVNSDNHIVVPRPVQEDKAEPMTAMDVTNIVNNINNTTNNENKAKPSMGMVRKSPLDTSKPESNSYIAQKPNLSNTPVIIEDATLSLMNLGYV